MKYWWWANDTVSNAVAGTVPSSSRLCSAALGCSLCKYKKNSCILSLPCRWMLCSPLLQSPSQWWTWQRNVAQYIVEYIRRNYRYFPPRSHGSLRDTSVQATSPRHSESSWSVVSENQVYLKSPKLDPRRCRSQKARLAIGMSLLAAALRVMQLQSVTA